MPYIDSAEINLLNGIFAGSIPFTRGLNLVSGENGTCKTQLLSALKQNQFKARDGQPRILAFSPKRNSERKGMDRLIQEARTRNQDMAQYLQQRASATFQDTSFDTYASFGDVYFYAYQNACKDGGKQIDKMHEIAKQFNDVVKQIFDSYELAVLWDDSRGMPVLRLRKWNLEIGPECLSLGEQEILSLAFNVYAARDSHDVILIDEPELHLNWHLEEKLFGFFDWFCSACSRQMIVATHSRVAFTSRFLPITWFLFWEDGRIRHARDIPDNQRRRIAGEAIEAFRLADLAKPVFFVEDTAQREVIEALMVALDINVGTSICGNASNVESLFRLSMREQGWDNCYFIRDGDNQGNPFPGVDRFIHLDRYCIENYLMDVECAAKVTGNPPDEVKQVIAENIKESRGKLSKGNKFIEKLILGLTADSVTDETLASVDGSAIFASFLKKTQQRREQYVREYIGQLLSDGRLESVFPAQLIRVMKGEQSLEGVGATLVKLAK